MNIRRSVFSGTWYPASDLECEREIQKFMNQAKPFPKTAKNPIGGIVPHAGWFFSGAIACNVIHCLSQGEMPDVVVIFGMHLHPGSLPHLMAEGAWDTPFGPLEVEKDLALELAGQFKFKMETPKRFIQDNTIELQLPFVKYFFKSVKIVAVGVPPAPVSLKIAHKIVDICENKGLKVKIIGSTDLTHYGQNYGFSPKGNGAEALKWVKTKNDLNFINALGAMNPEQVIRESLEHHNACCGGAAASAVAASKKLGATQALSLDYATSHDKQPSDSFVGYAGVVFI